MRDCEHSLCDPECEPCLVFVEIPVHEGADHRRDAETLETVESKSQFSATPECDHENDEDRRYLDHCGEVENIPHESPVGGVPVEPHGKTHSHASDNPCCRSGLDPAFHDERAVP